jgi:hypothetical protein
MILSRFVFKLISAWYSILLGNLAILGLIGFAVYTTMLTASTDMIIDLRCETISAIVIAWGVVLESRDLLINNGHLSHHQPGTIETTINFEVERSGIFLVVMGLFLEMTTYFDLDVRAEMLPNSIHSMLVWAEWAVVAMLTIELLGSCFTIARIRTRKGLNA